LPTKKKVAEGTSSVRRKTLLTVTFRKLALARQKEREHWVARWGGRRRGRKAEVVTLTSKKKCLENWRGEEGKNAVVDLGDQARHLKGEGGTPLLVSEKQKKGLGGIRTTEKKKRASGKKAELPGRGGGGLPRPPSHRRGRKRKRSRTPTEKGVSARTEKLLVHGDGLRR